MPYNTGAPQRNLKRWVPKNQPTNTLWAPFFHGRQKKPGVGGDLYTHTLRSRPQQNCSGQTIISGRTSHPKRGAPYFCENNILGRHTMICLPQSGGGVVKNTPRSGAPLIIYHTPAGHRKEATMLCGPPLLLSPLFFLLVAAVGKKINTYNTRGAETSPPPRGRRTNPDERRRAATRTKGDPAKASE